MKREEISEQLTTIVGKTIRESRKEMEMSLKKAKLILESSDQIFSESTVFTSSDSKITKKVLWDPLGVVFALSPWECPVFETMDTVVAAILSGNSVLLKDHTETPIFSKYFHEALDGPAPGLVQRCFIDPSQVQSLYSDNAI